MGLRGPQPKSAEVRVLEGERAHRPLPAARPAAAAPGLPERPRRMTAAARRVWDSYVEQLAQLGTIRPVDGFALQQLCENRAFLEELQFGLRKMAAALRRLDAERLAKIDSRLAQIELQRGEAVDDSAALCEEHERLSVERIEVSLRMRSRLTDMASEPKWSRVMTRINSLASLVQRQELQFGLTPVSAGRVEPMYPVIPPGSAVSADTSIEAALCG